MNKIDSQESHEPFVSLADRAVRIYVTEGRVIDPPGDLPEGMERSAGVFVSIKKNDVLPDRADDRRGSDRQRGQVGDGGPEVPPDHVG